MNKTKSILLRISESEADSESDDSVDILTEQVKELIECDRRQVQKNVLNGEILPSKLRPSVVYRAFKKNTTSTPLAAKGYRHFFASDSSLSPIRISDYKENDSKKTASVRTEYQIKTRSGKSAQSVDLLLEKNGVDTEINHDESIQNSKTVISDEKNKFINSNNNVTPEISTNNCKKPQRISENERITRSRLKNNNNLTNNLLANGTLSESINKTKSTTSKRTSINASNANNDSLPNSKICNIRNTSPEKIIVRSPSPSHKNIENPAATVINKALFNLSNDKTPLIKTRKSRSSFRSLSPKSERRKSNITPDNGKAAVSRSAGKSFLPVRISKSRKNIRKPLQVQNTDSGTSKEKEVEKKDDNSKVTSKSVDLAKKGNLTRLSEQLSNTESDKLLNDNGKEAVDVTKPKPPVPKPRIKKTTEIATNTEEIYHFKPRQVDKSANKTFSSNSSDSINKRTRLSKFIDSISNKEKTTPKPAQNKSKTTPKPAQNKSKTVSSRSVQTSYRKSSIGLSKHPNRQEIQTQTSYKRIPSEQNSSDGVISNYSDFLDDCTHEGNLFDSLKQPKLLERFSTSYDDYGLLENSKKPWRVDENLNLPTRNSIHFSFIKSASSIEVQQLDAVKQIKQYKEQRKSEKTVAKQMDSSGSMIETTDDNGEIMNDTLVNRVENGVAKSNEDEVESSSVATFRPEVEVNTRKNPIETSAVEDQVIETAVEERVSNDAVSEWVANINNEFKNTDVDDSPCSFYEEDLIKSVEKTGRPKIAKALFRSETGSDKGSCSDIPIVLIESPTKNVTDENNEAGAIIRSEQFKDATTDDQIDKNKDKMDGVFKVPSKKAVRSVKSKKNQPAVVTPNNSVEISESDTTGVRRSGRRRCPAKLRTFDYVIISTKTDQKRFADMIHNLDSENCSTIMSSSLRTSRSKKKRQTLEDKTPNQKRDTSENGKKNTNTPKNQLFLIPENSSCGNKSVVNRSNTRASKNKRKSVLAESPINVAEQDTFTDTFDNDHQTDGVKDPKQLKVIINRCSRTSRRRTNGSGNHTKVNTTTRKTRSEKSVFNEIEPNEIVDTLYNDYKVFSDKDPQQLEVTYNNREITHESYQYDKITNPSKCISSDSGRSTLIRSSIDDLNVRSGRITKASVKRKTRPRRGRPAKNATTKVSNVADGDVAKAKDLNNVNGEDEKCRGVPSDAEKFKYIEENPVFSQHYDNLKYSDPLDHTNGASMVYLEIPPGEIKKKHTNRRHNLFYCVVEGRGRVYIGDEVSGVKKKSRFLIPTGLSYSIINDGIDETLLLACVKMPVS